MENFAKNSKYCSLALGINILFKKYLQQLEEMYPVKKKLQFSVNVLQYAWCWKYFYMGYNIK